VAFSVSKDCPYNPVPCCARIVLARWLDEGGCPGLAGGMAAAAKPAAE